MNTGTVDECREKSWVINNVNRSIDELNWRLSLDENCNGKCNKEKTTPKQAHENRLNLFIWIGNILIFAYDNTFVEERALLLPILSQHHVELNTHLSKTSPWVLASYAFYFRSDARVFTE